MERRIKEYLAQMDLLLEQNCSLNWKQEMEKHLVQISFFQHERLVHLIVTAIFAVLEMMCFLSLLFIFSPGLLVLTLLILILLVPYIRHYYILENGVQKMYHQYDAMAAKKTETNSIEG